MWGAKKGKNARYDADDFLRIFFYSEITGRSIDNASERLNRYFISKKKRKAKNIRRWGASTRNSAPNGCKQVPTKGWA